MIEINGRSVPDSLEELIAPSHTALLIIDMQNGFCSGGPSIDRRSSYTDYRSATLKIAEFVKTCRQQRVHVIHVRMLSGPDGSTDSPYWLRMRWRARREEPVPFTEGSWSALFIPELHPAERDVIITKYRSSAFFGTALDTVLRSLNVQTVLCVGCTTEGCVESTVRDAGFHDFFPVVLSDCVVTTDEQLHRASLLTMGAYRADIATSKQVSEIWQAKSSDSANKISVIT